MNDHFDFYEMAAFLGKGVIGILFFVLFSSFAVLFLTFLKEILGPAIFSFF